MVVGFRSQKGDLKEVGEADFSDQMNATTVSRRVRRTSWDLDGKEMLYLPVFTQVPTNL